MNISPLAVVDPEAQLGENITIDNCFIATGDDGIVLKSDTGAIKNVAVSNCSIFSLANNFKIGTETVHDISNVAVTDCHFFKADTAGGYAGIAIESADGANVANVAVANIVMDGVTSPLLVWLGCRLDNGNTSRRPGSVANITVLNVKATDVDIASAIVGCNYDGTVFNVGNVVLDNFDITYRDCAETLDIYQGDSVLDANMSGYPEITRVSHRYLSSHEMSEYYDIPYYGLYVDKAVNVIATNFNVTPRSSNTRAMANIPIQG